MSANTKPWVLGLTGPSGSGKSTVCTFLQGAEYKGNSLRFIDADMVARQVVEPGSPCLEKLSGLFGREILLSDGGLNRRKLGNMVFGSSKQVEKLNQTIFPYILEEIQRQMNHFALEKGVNGIILDAPTLFESGADKMCSITASVLAPREIRIERICKRDGISKEAAIKRIDSQQPDRFYQTHSNFVLINGNQREKLESEIQKMAFWLGLIPSQNFRFSQRRRRKRQNNPLQANF